MNKIPIVFTFDKRIIPAASIAIKSLVESADCDTIYDIYILHSDIELKYQKEISKLTDKTRHTVSFKYVDSKIFKNYKKSSHSWSEIVYYRLLIADYLPMLDKAIYSDCDVFFKQDLSEVYNVNIENYEIAAVAAEKNTKDAIGHKYFPENQNEFIYWSGFLVLNCKKIREENYFENASRCRVISNLYNLKDNYSDLGKIIKIEEPEYKTVYEAKVEILDEAEKRYLREVIRPYKTVKYINKSTYGGGKKAAVTITVIDIDGDNWEIQLPPFETRNMYKNMKEDKEYTLEELGL